MTTLVFEELEQLLLAAKKKKITKTNQEVFTRSIKIRVGLKVGEGIMITGFNTDFSVFQHSLKSICLCLYFYRKLVIGNPKIALPVNKPTAFV